MQLVQNAFLMFPLGTACSLPHSIFHAKGTGLERIHKTKQRGKDSLHWHHCQRRENREYEASRNASCIVSKEEGIERHCSKTSCSKHEQSLGARDYKQIFLGREEDAPPHVLAPERVRPILHQVCNYDPQGASLAQVVPFAPCLFFVRAQSLQLVAQIIRFPSHCSFNLAQVNVRRIHRE